MNKFYRINQNIKADTVRVISEEGQLGVMPLREALDKAATLGVDLIEVASEANPPVVKLIEFSKFKYQENKKEKAGQNKATQDTKELQLKPFMAENDLLTKVNRIKEFLGSGDKVRLVVKFKGRAITKKEFGEKLLAQVLEMLSGEATVVEAPKFLGKNLVTLIKPKK